MRRAGGVFLYVLMVLGCFALWIVVPGGILWGLGRIVETKANHFLLALIAVPAGMVVFATLLVRLNDLYLRVNGLEEADDEGERVLGVRSPLDRILVVCSIVALVALLGWLAFAPTVRIGDCGCGL